MTLRARLTGAVATLLLLLATSLVLSWREVRAIDRLSGDVAALDDAARTLHALAAAVRDAWAHQAHMVILDDTSHMPRAHVTLTQARAALATARVQLGAHLDDARDLDAIGALIARLNDDFHRDVVPLLPAPSTPATTSPTTMPGGDGAHDDTHALHVHGASTGPHDAAQARAAAIAFAPSIQRLEELQTAVDRVATRLDARARASRDEVAHTRAAAEQRAVLVALLGLLLGVVVVVVIDRAAAAREAQMVEQERLAGVGRLAAGVAHEINNPLAVMLGHARLLSSSAREHDDPQGERDAQAIVTEVKRAQAIVDGLLDLSRPPRLVRRSIDLAGLVDDVATSLGIEADDGRLQLVRHGDTTLAVDDKKLRQVLANLLRNAHEAAPGKPIHIDVRGDEHGVQLRVRDEGPGIAPAIRARLFEPFATTKDNGTGLGLAVSRSLVQGHGGTLQLDDDATSPGACFVVALPRTRETHEMPGTHGSQEAT